jgi:Uma2 family endonuclease
VRRGRLIPDEPPEGYITIAPDLVVEVVSPNDLYYEVDRKVEEYLDAGVQLVWVINPDTRSVQVYVPGSGVTRLDDSQELTGRDVLPGFACRVGDLFPAPATN